MGRRDEFLPAHPETVALYLVALAEAHRPSTITRRLTAIAKAHSTANHPNPATTGHAIVSETLKGIRRTLETAQPGKTPLLTADLVQVLAHLPANLSGVSDGLSCSPDIPAVSGGRSWRRVWSKIWSGSRRGPS